MILMLCCIGSNYVATSDCFRREQSEELSSLARELSDFSQYLWLDKTRRKPLLQTVEKMKEELMLLGFISLLLTATSSIISNICISSKFFGGIFSLCSESEVHEATEEDNPSEGRKLWTSTPQTFRRLMSSLHQNTCLEGKEPFVSYEGLEQLHRFIFIMAVTHVSYSCLTMLLAIVKIHSWRKWEDQAHLDRHDALTGESIIIESASQV
ncbi:MLO-like protein 11 isoform X2 [Spinacia oleracea]|uniref:MLO-like protein 11 isoform X2 n=2 Tax=Spinacia oleracea TaxID=3562 RepID=A0ABM3RV23_SPIOL|nr:MLO-like protein 11 isoform X2 [Spinacia oleracea]